jgi:uncharacterized protein YecA (UPF0149 family)
MNIDTGNIIDMGWLMLQSSRARAMYASRQDRTIPMAVAPTQKQLARKRVGRNDPCPCGSGKKFKRCHYKTPEAVA